MAAPEDGIIHLADIETGQCDVQELEKTPKGTHNTFATGRVYNIVQIGNDFELSGQVQRTLHHRRYMRSLSPRSYYKNNVSFLLLNSNVFKLCCG